MSKPNVPVEEKRSVETLTLTSITTSTSGRTSSYWDDDDSQSRAERKIRLDWIIKNKLGEFGRYQRTYFFLLGLPAMVCAMHAFAWVFLGANVQHRCLLDGEDASTATYYNLPPGRTMKNSYPWHNETGVGHWSQCSKYKAPPQLPNYENIYDTGPFPTNRSKTATAQKVNAFDEEKDDPTLSKHEDHHSSKEVVECNGKFVYDDSQYKTTARIEFHLICETKFWYAFAETLSKAGILCGALCFGYLSDRFGRKPVFFYSLCQQVVVALVAAFSPNYTVFVISRFLIGMSISGVFLVAYVIAIELVGPSYRIYAGIGIPCFFAMGMMLEALLAYFIRYWRNLQMAFAFPGFIFLSYFCIMPESVRWLIARGKKEKAIVILKKIAKMNRVTIEDSVLDRLQECDKSKTRNVHCWTICRSRRTLLRSLNIFFCWFVNSGVYYGLGLNSGNLGGNDYLNFSISALIEIPALLMLVFTLNRFGRKPMMCGCTIMAGVCLIICGLIPHEYRSYRIGMNMVGKFFNSAGYCTTYIFSAELFPTVIRNSFMGISSLCARIGGILSDYVILGQAVWKPLPHIVFGSVSLVAGFLSILLPETLGKRLPETMEDGEAFGTSSYQDDKDDDEGEERKSEEQSEYTEYTVYTYVTEVSGDTGAVNPVSCHY